MLRRVTAGERILTEPLNSIIREFERRGCEGGTATAQSMPANICIAKNDTGRDLCFGEAAQLGDLEIFDYRDFLANPTLRLVAPTDAYIPRAWVVAAEDIPAGAAGAVFESGIFPARIRYFSNEFMVENNNCVEFIVETDNRQDWWHLSSTTIGTAKLLFQDNRKQTGPENDDWSWGIIRHGGYSCLPVIYEITYVDPQKKYVLAVPYAESGGSGLPERRFELP